MSMKQVDTHKSLKQVEGHRFLKQMGRAGPQGRLSYTRNRRIRISILVTSLVR